VNADQWFANYARRPRCPVTGKEIFSDEREVKGAAAAFGHAKGSGKYHPCEICNGWHLTKNERGPKRKGRR